LGDGRVPPATNILSSCINRLLFLAKKFIVFALFSRVST
jgi:hypothetical protein